MGTGYLQQQFSAWLLQLSILAIHKGWVWLSHSVSAKRSLHLLTAESQLGAEAAAVSAAQASRGKREDVKKE